MSDSHVEASERAILELTREIAAGVKNIIVYNDTLSSQLSALGTTFQDDGFSAILRYISKTQNKVHEAIPDLNTVVAKLTEYAMLLHESKTHM